VWAEPFSGLRATKKSSTSATTGVAAALFVAARLGGAGLARLEAVGEGRGALTGSPGHTDGLAKACITMLIAANGSASCSGAACVLLAPAALPARPAP
jgi:hypothetical protein